MSSCSFLIHVIASLLHLHKLSDVYTLNSQIQNVNVSKNKRLTCFLLSSSSRALCLSTMTT